MEYTFHICATLKDRISKIHKNAADRILTKNGAAAKQRIKMLLKLLVSKCARNSYGTIWRCTFPKDIQLSRNPIMEIKMVSGYKQSFKQTISHPKSNTNTTKKHEILNRINDMNMIIAAQIQVFCVQFHNYTPCPKKALIKADFCRYE